MSESIGNSQETYVAVNRNTLIDMIDTAVELPMFTRPNVAVHERNGNYQPAFAEGVPEPVYTAAEINESGVAAKIGEMSIIVAASRAVMELVCDMLDQTETEWKPMSEAEQQAYSHTLFDTVQAAVDDSAKSYALTLFTDNDSGEQISIETVTINGVEHGFYARELTLQIVDEFVSRKLNVSDIGWHDAPATIPSGIRVKQEIVPVRDQDINDMSQFFVEHDDTESIGVMLSIFPDILKGDPTKGLNELLKRYDEAGRTRIQGFIAMMQQRAAHFMEERAVQRANPELSLPTAEELVEYAQILTAIRS